jgi:hypothetical protein
VGPSGILEPVSSVRTEPLEPGGEDAVIMARGTRPFGARRIAWSYRGRRDVA